MGKCCIQARLSGRFSSRFCGFGSDDSRPLPSPDKPDVRQSPGACRRIVKTQLETGRAAFHATVFHRFAVVESLSTLDATASRPDMPYPLLVIDLAAVLDADTDAEVFTQRSSIAH